MLIAVLAAVAYRQTSLDRQQGQNELAKVRTFVFTVATGEGKGVVMSRIEIAPHPDTGRIEMHKTMVDLGQLAGTYSSCGQNGIRAMFIQAIENSTAVPVTQPFGINLLTQ